MKKLKKMDVKAGQTVYSFKCPCGICQAICDCYKAPNLDQVQLRISEKHDMNASTGGSATGGAGW